MNELKKTSFYDFHRKHNAKLIDFGGWLMPVQYSKIQDEHLAVRTNAGLFDCSHMGEFFVEGNNAQDFIEYLVANSVADKNEYKAIYSPMCNEKGGIIDDIVIYKFSCYKFMLVVNASNIDKDFLWISKFLKNFDVNIYNKSDEFSLLALQGPKSKEILKNVVFNVSKLDNLIYYSFYEDIIDNIPVIISRTGYTGELGYELYFNNKYSEKIINIIEEEGKKFSLRLCGLGARDSLRLEKCYLLYGNDISEDVNPLEADIKWTVKFNKDFIGKKSLENFEIKKKLVAFEMIDNRIPRHNYKIFSDNKEIGFVTSGGISFVLNKNIGMGYVNIDNAKKGENIKIQIKDKFYCAKIVKKPFV